MQVNSGKTIHGNYIPKEPLGQKSIITESSKDREFSLKNAAGNFGKGIVSPVTAMFSSPENFLIGAGTVVAGGALLVATGGAAAPALVALGVGMGGAQIAKGVAQFATAKTTEEKENAFYDMGAGASGVALSALGAKSGLKSAGMNVKQVDNMSVPQALMQTFKQLPATVKNSAQAFQSGEAITNLTQAAQSLKTFIPRKSDSKTDYTFKPKSEIKLKIEAKEKELRPIAQELADKATADFPEAIAQVQDILGQDGKVIGRPKGTSSVGTKLAKKAVEKDRIYTDADSAINDIGDAIGSRLILKHGNSSEVDQAVKSLAKAVSEGKLDITEVHNYRGPDGYPYFSDEHIQMLKEAVIESNQKGLSSLKIEDFKVTNLTDTTKPSGYTTAQMNIRHKNGALGELQVRGPKINHFAEVEHIIYDMRQGKALEGIFSPNLKADLLKLKNTLENLPQKDYAEYLGYIDKFYKHYRSMEQGQTNLPKPTLPNSLKQYPELNVEHIDQLHNQMLGFKKLNRLKPASRIYLPYEASRFTHQSDKQVLGY